MNSRRKFRLEQKNKPMSLAPLGRVNSESGRIKSPDAGCYTAPDGACVSETPCMHTPPSIQEDHSSCQHPENCIVGIDFGWEKPAAVTVGCPHSWHTIQSKEYRDPYCPMCKEDAMPVPESGGAQSGKLSATEPNHSNQPAYRHQKEFGNHADLPQRPPTITMNQNVLDALGEEEAQEVIRELAAATGEPVVNAEVVPNGQLSEEYGFQPRCQQCNAVIGEGPEYLIQDDSEICVGCGRVTNPTPAPREWVTNGAGGYLTSPLLDEEVRYAQGKGPVPDRQFYHLQGFTALQIRKAMRLEGDPEQDGTSSKSTRKELETIFNKMDLETRYRVSKACGKFRRS